MLVAGAATLFSLFVLEIRHIRVLSMLDGRRWASRVRDDEPPPGRTGPEDEAEADDP